MKRSATGARGIAAGMSGQVLLLFLTLLSLILLLLGMAVLTVAHAEFRSAAREKRLDGVQFAAESGIEYAAVMLASARPATPYLGGPMPVSVNMASVVISRPIFEIEVDHEDYYRIVSSARWGTIHVEIEAQVAVKHSESEVGSRVISWKSGRRRLR